MREQQTPIIVPVKRPFTRMPIKPVERHRDDKNDYRRVPKHPKENSDE